MQVFLLVAVGVFSADGIALALKVLFGRKRPFITNPEQDPLVRAPLDLAFPSGHAATSFAGALLLSRLAPRLTVPLFVLAAGVAVSRVYVGVHYPLDIVGGAVLGLLVGAAAFRLVGRSRAARADVTG